MSVGCIAACLLLTQVSPWVISIRDSIRAANPDADRTIREKVGAEQLKNGVTSKEHSAFEGENAYQLFAIDAGPEGKSGRIVGDTIDPIPLTKVGNLLATVATLKSGVGCVLHYEVDGVARPSFNYEIYTPNPLGQRGDVPLRGELRDLGQLVSEVYPGTTRKLYVYLPPNLEPGRAYPVLFATDAQWDRDWLATFLDKCAAAKVIPPTVGVFTEAGQNSAGDGFKHRSQEYDPLTPTYTKFLLTEVEPKVAALVTLSQDPTQRACFGVSSGGICAFTSCWERPDKFGTAISAVGSFTDIAHGDDFKQGGHNYPFLIRQMDKKPIRVFLQDGSHDLDNQFGNWFLSNQQMAAALKFKGYDFEFHQGQGFHSTDHMRRIFDHALVWWNGIRER